MRKELPERIAPYDLLILGAASYRLSRIITKERVAAPLRSPVTKQSFDDSGLTNQEQPRGEGAERVLGELVTCPFCVGSWVAAGFTYSLVLAPRHTRFIAGILAVDAASGLLHCVFSKMRS